MLHRVVLLAVFALGCSEYELNPDLDPNDPLDDDDPTDVDGDGDPVVEGDTGGIHGRICSPNEAIWVAGATVWVDTDAGAVSTTTDGDGWFLLEGVPVGVHTVKVEKGSFSTDFVVEVFEDEVTELAQEECLRDDVEIAVVTGLYDSIEHVLDRLGLDYTIVPGVNGQKHVQLLRSPADLEQYDIIFFNCGMNDNWLPHRAEVATNLRDYVSAGGSIYVSDWSYYLVETAYPEMVTFIGDDNIAGDAYAGVEGYVDAEVLDPAMAAALGSDQASIYYDLGSWAAPDRVDHGTPLLRGTYTYYHPVTWNPVSEEGPLAARMGDGSGTVLYTSFHNEQQTTLDMDVLLQEIIFSL